MEQNYLQSLIDLATQELESYKLTAEDFEKINTFFIKKVLNEENTNLFIQLAETKKLYLSVISASFLFMYEKNYNFKYSKNIQFNDDDYVFNTRNRRYEQFRNHDNIKNFSYEIEDFFIKINKDNLNRNEINQIVSFYEFIKNHLPSCGIKSISRCRLAIVCNKKEFIDTLKNDPIYKIIPYRYLTKDGNPNDNLPIEPIIYIASDYQTICDHIFGNREQLEAVIFFDKYNDSETISKDIREGQLKKCIFIGIDDLQIENNSVLKWRWTPEECCHFYPDYFPLAQITPIYVDNINLLDAISNFITNIEKIEQQYTVQFSSLKYYARKALYTVIPQIDSLLILKEKFLADCEEILFNELYAVGVEKQLIDDYSKNFQDCYQDIIMQIQFSSNAKAEKLANLNYDYLIVSSEHKDSWQNKLPNKKVWTYAEWKRNEQKNKQVLFLGLYGYSHYQTLKNSNDNITILIYRDSQEQKSFEYYQDKYNLELENEYHSPDRKKLTDIDYPIPKKERIKLEPDTFNNTEKDNDAFKNQRNYQRDEVFLKYIFSDKTFEILPISRHVLIQQGDLLISEKLENVKVGDELRIYQNFNKDKLEEIATPKQKQDILECKRYAELWKKSLFNFYHSKYYRTEKLLADLQNKGADITLNTLNKWLDMKDKSLFPTKVKNIIAISELLNDDKLKENLKEINKKRNLYRSIMIALGRDFSDAISRYMTNNERTDLLKNFPDAQIQKMLKENIRVKKLVKITEPNAEEQFEQISLIFEDNNAVENNENHQPPPKEEDNMTNEEFQELIQESEKLAEQAKEQADSLDESVDNLESDISNKLDSVIAENSELRKEVNKLKEDLQEAENQIDSLATMQKKHHEAIKYLLDSFKKLNAKVDNLRNSLK
jgi:hypothetical protein